MEEKVITKSEDVVTKTVKAKTSRTKAKTRRKDDLSFNDRVSIDNLCAWVVGFVSEENGRAIQIDPGVVNYKKLTLAEVDSQVKVGNIAFCGIDGFGSHAAFRINDPLVRESVFGEDISPVQLTVDAVNDLLASKNKKEFYNKLSSLVVTDSEKKMIAIMCSDSERYPDVNIADMPSYMIAEIEKISGLDLD